MKDPRKIISLECKAIPRIFHKRDILCKSGQQDILTRMIFFNSQ